MILLTPEQIEKTVAEIVMDTPFVSSVEEQTERLKRFASKLNKTQLKKVVDFIKSRAWQTGQYGTMKKGYLITEDDLQALLKEVE